jgi:putative ABC transport system permease protein
MDEPLKIAGSIQAAISRVERKVPLYGTTTLEDRLREFLTPRRFQTSLVVWFCAFALLMTAIGIYGLIQYSVATRTQEIGIRMAIGAQTGYIFRMIIGEGLKLSLARLVLELAGALRVRQLGRNLLFGVAATDPMTLIAVSVLLTVVAISASALPARRATKIEPMAALRLEWLRVPATSSPRDLVHASYMPSSRPTIVASYHGAAFQG